VYAATLTTMLRNARLDVRSMVDVDQHPPTGAFHWTVLAEATRGV
jgi:hypothetical protein